MNDDRMTPEALAGIEGLAAEATEGTWVVDKMGRFEDHDECRISLPDDEIELCRYENADFIVASRLAVPQMAAEIRRAWEELGAAKEDMRALSDEYKFCNMCKYHNGEGVDTCSHPLRFSCDAENFYEWLGVPANTPAQGATDETRGGGNE